MRLLAIVHQPDAGPGVFLDTIRGRGAELHCWQPPEAGPLGCDPHDYDAVLTFGGAAHPDSEAQHPWLAEEKALLGELLERGFPCSASASARSCWPRLPALPRAARSSLRSAGTRWSAARRPHAIR